MITYESFIGIDIGKYSFFVVLHGNKKVYEYENTPAGINEFIKFHRKTLKKGLCILETTGGYEMGVLLRLCSEGFAVHRANTRKVKHFIKSYGNAAKTDKLDAKNLALYGYERGRTLELFTPVSICLSVIKAGATTSLRVIVKSFLHFNVLSFRSTILIAKSMPSRIKSS